MNPPQSSARSSSTEPTPKPTSTPSPKPSADQPPSDQLPFDQPDHAPDQQPDHTPDQQSDRPAVVGPISVSQFYPFVLADPLTKRAELRAIKNSYGIYTPAVDYWRLFRLQAMAQHRFTAGRGLDALDTAIELAHPSRQENYELAVGNYRRFIGRKRIEWLGRPPRAIWEAGELQVRVNPELWVSIDGEPHVIKLYLRTEPKWALNQRLANPLVHLIATAHGDLGTPIVFDVLRGRAFGLTRPELDYEGLLVAQAAAFVSLWNVDTDQAASAVRPEAA